MTQEHEGRPLSRRASSRPGLVRRWVPALTVAAAIFLLSDVPHLSLWHDPLPQGWQDLVAKYTFRIGQGGFFSYVISPKPDFILHKLGHIMLYGMLGLLVYWATGKRGLLTVLLVALFAGSDELHQAFVPGRSSRLGDILLDVAAAALFIWVASRLGRRK